MKLRAQFAVLTVAVTALPLVFALLFFGFQREPKDPRIPTREFVHALLERWSAGEALDIGILQEEASNAGIPLKEAALISPEGKVLLSTFPSIKPGSQMKFSDVIPQRQASREIPRPELKLMALDHQNPASPFVLFDLQPLWTKQDLRNRTILLAAFFALAIFVVAGIISLLILKSISHAIRTLEEDTAIVATGALDHEVTGSANHEILQLAKSINLMRLNLKDILLRRSKMLMGISHDLKTPIALIQGYADALADNLASDSETRERYVEIIQGKARQLEDLTGELIDFLKIGGDGSVPVQDVDLEEMFLALGSRFESDSGLLKRRFQWGFGEQLLSRPDFPLPRLAINRLLVERALENLFSNALKYSAPDSAVEFRLLREEKGLAFSISDEGQGIEEKDLPFVFDAFYRASPSRGDSGHGFGLTVVKAVAELHGWGVEIGGRKDGKPGTEARLSVPC